MARIRTVKPEMAQDEDLAACSIEAQLLAIRILNFADDEGYFKAHPALIKASCFPLIDSLNIPVMLRELSKSGYLRLGIGTDGKEYGQVVNFLKHQSINKPYPSKIKDLVKFPECSGSDTGTLPAGMEWNGMEKDTSDSDESNAPVPISEIRNAKFEEWYDAYAKKVGRKDAESAWRNLKWAKHGVEPDDLIADTLERHKHDPQWPKYQPHPATYLNGLRWTDELPLPDFTLPKDRDDLWRIRAAIGLDYQYDDLKACHAEITQRLRARPELREVAGL